MPAALNRRQGLVITPESSVPRCYGERLDLPAAVGAVLAFADSTSHPRDG